MKRVTILALYDAVPSTVVDPRIILTGVNELLEGQGKPAAFSLQLVGLEKDVRLSNGAFSVHTDALLHDVSKTDLVIVPAVGSPLPDAIEKNRAFLPWIVKQYEGGAEVASLCVGAFVLAATGLLDGKECSSHWLTAPQFRAMFPGVTLVDGRIVTEQNGLYSSGGATSYYNLLLHLIEKYAGRETAILASKIYALQFDRKSQSPFAIFQGQKAHEDEPVKQAQVFIEANVAERIAVDELASHVAISRRQFERRFKKATHNTPLEYIQRVKTEAAKKLFEDSDKNINEVMFAVGYDDPKAFRSVFKKLTGLSPVAYRNRYNKEAAVA